MLFAPTKAGIRLGLGGAPAGNLFHAISDAEAVSLVEDALADGCRSFDTAPHYGNGLSEHRFGHAFRGANRSEITLSTKVGRLLVPDANAPREQNGYVDVLPFTQRWDYSASGVRRSIEDSLQRLGLARLDAVFIHDCDRASHGERYPAVLDQVVTEAIPELTRLKQEGLLAGIGLGVNDVQVCLDVLARADLDCLLLAGRYSLIDHTGLAELLPLCARRGVRIALGGAFNSGILATGVRQPGATLRFNYGPAAREWIERTAAIEEICDQFAVPLRAAALQFPLGHPAIEIVLVGAQNREQWSDAAAMMNHPIPAAFWAKLKTERLLPDEAPVPERA